jgi:hypothetical protein
MNLTSSLNHATSQVWKRLSWRSTLGLAALAMVAAAAVVVSPRGGDASQAFPARPSPPSISVRSDAAIKTVYIVQTPQQAETLLQEQITLLQSGLLQMSPVPEVVVDATPELEALMETTQISIALASRGEDSGLRVIDLRPY